MSAQSELDHSDDEDYQIFGRSERDPNGSAKIDIQQIERSEDTAAHLISINGRSDASDEEELDESERSAQTWWTREEQAKFIDADIFRPVAGSDGDDDREPFTKRKSISTILHRATDGRPLIYKRMIWPGSGSPVELESTVSFHLSAYTEGEPVPFDCSVTRGKPYLVRVDNSPLLPGVLYALLSMQVGEKAEFIVVAELAYGREGCPPRIPPNEEVLFIITIKKVHTEGSIGNYLMLTAEEQAKLPFEEVLAVVNSEKQSGNNYYNSGKFTEALTRYKRAIRFLCDCQDPGGEGGKVVDEILSKLLTNAANASLQLKNYSDCIKFCKKALKLNGENVKALYFCGTSYLRLEKLKESKTMLQRACQLKANNRDITAMLVEIAAQENACEEESKQLAKQMARVFDLPPRH